MPIKQMLCAVDDSEPSLRAAEFAVDLADRCDAELLLLKVIRTPGALQNDIADYLRHERNADPQPLVLAEIAEDELRMLGERIARQRGVTISSEVRAGDAATEIATAARDHASDLIVVGHCAHSRLAMTLIGSTARDTIENAPCPVLVVK